MLRAVRPARKARRGCPAEATPRPGPSPEREARSVPAPTAGPASAVLRPCEAVSRGESASAAPIADRRPYPTALAAARLRRAQAARSIPAARLHAPGATGMAGPHFGAAAGRARSTRRPRPAGDPCLLGPPLPDRQALPSNQWHEVGRRSGCSTAGRRHSGWLSVVEQEQCTSYSPACTWPAICRLTGRSFSWAAALPRVHLYPRHRPRGLLLRPASRWPPCRDGVGCFGKSYFWLCH